MYIFMSFITKKNLPSDFFLFNVIHTKNKKNWEINFTRGKIKFSRNCSLSIILRKFEFIMEWKCLECRIFFTDSSRYRYLYFVHWLPLVFP